MKNSDIAQKKYYIIILVIFIFYGFLLTPLGDYKHYERNHPGYYSINRIDLGDDAGYYAYLRSGLIDGDFDFFNEKRYWHFDVLTPTWYTANYWPMGQAIVWMPFFLVGHAISGLLILMGYPVTADGYSFPYYILTSIASGCEVFLALLLCYKLLGKFFPRGVCLATTILVFASTSLPYFAFIRNRTSHSGDVLFSFLFFLLFLKFRQNKEQPFSFFIFWGLIAGFLLDMRYINLVYLFIPLVIIIETFALNKIEHVQKQKILSGVLLGGVAFIITILPQLTAWKKLHGIFNPMNPLQIIVQPTFSSVSGSIKNLFFGTSWGFATSEPIWLLGIVGLFLWLFRDRGLGIICLVIFAGFCITPIILGNGNSFGQRYLLSALPILALGVGQFIDVVRKKILVYFLVPLGILICGWMYILLLTYKVYLHYDTPHFALQAFKNIPDIFRIKIYFRPTTLPDIFLNGHFILSDYYDYFFLIFYPLLQVGLPVLFLFVFWKTFNMINEGNNFQVRAMEISSAVFLFFMSFLTLFILVRHPDLTQQDKKERLQIAAVSSFMKVFPDLNNFNKNILKAKVMYPDDETTQLILADSKFIVGSFDKAIPHYLKALSANKKSLAGFQLDRIDVITGKKIISESLLIESLKKGDPSGEINRWLGIYYLDKHKQPEKAIAFFKKSLQDNPEQGRAKSLKTIIRQFSKQKQRLVERGIAMGSIPPFLNHMLNTHINTLRLETISIDYPY